jgi:hypothetical protein
MNRISGRANLTNGYNLTRIVEQQSKGIIPSRGDAKNTALGLEPETLAEESGILPNLRISDLGEVNCCLDSSTLAGCDRLSTEKLVVELNGRGKEADVQRESLRSGCCVHVCCHLVVKAL